MSKIGVNKINHLRREKTAKSTFYEGLKILEGRRITRILYQLRFEGKKEISFVIPEGSSLQKVYLNNAAVPFSQKEGRFHLEVTPARAGDESARLELVLTKDQGEYFLSGNLDFTFPSASWNVNELQVELHLPQVFNYTWSSGSLASTGRGVLLQPAHPGQDSPFPPAADLLLPESERRLHRGSGRKLFPRRRLTTCGGRGRLLVDCPSAVCSTRSNGSTYPAFPP